MFIIQIYLARAKVGLTFPLYLRTPTWPSLVIESANAKGRALESLSLLGIAALQQMKGGMTYWRGLR